MFRIDPWFAGETVVVIAGGPSVTADQIRRVGVARLEGKVRVIAIKDAIYLAWWADWLYGCDARWWNVHIQSAQHFKGIKTTLAEGLPEAWGVGLLRNTGKLGFDPDPSSLRTGGNSGYQAMHCAAHAGAKKIIVLGVDMKRSRDGRRHWFDTHKYQLEPNYSVTMLPTFETLAPAMKERNIEVVNCSLDSAVTCFQKLPLEAVL